MDNKACLLNAIAGKNRGLLINENDKVKILSIIKTLEDENPTPNPLEAKELLQGNWRLLYTSSKSILGLNNLPLAELGEIYQYINVEQKKIYNIAETFGLPFLEGLVSVAATFEIESPKRIQVNFQRSIIGLQRVLNYTSPTDFINKIENNQLFLPFDLPIGKLSQPFSNSQQKPWLETTYLDEDLRLGRGNHGNVFVLGKNNR